MSEEKDRNRWVDAVTRMIELTQQGKMHWQVVDSPDKSKDDEHRTSAAFRANLNGRLLRLYQKKVQESTLASEGLHSLLRPKFETIWRTKVVLEFINAEGATLWAFPYVEALGDLLTAVQYQVAGVNDFLDNLFGETNAAA